MSYGPLRPDLTPADLRAAGYTVRAHINGGWCWWKRNPFGSGEIYGASFGQIDDVYADARRVAPKVGWTQPMLLEVA